MKTSLKLIALFLAAGFTSVALAETIDGSIPVVANVEFIVIALSVAFLGLMVVSDYTRRARTLSVKAQAVAPAVRSSRENHRLAA